jgi:preprotein translocase subunit SecA
VLDFDDVMNRQREVVYGYRNEILESENPHELIAEAIGEIIPEKVREHLELSEGEPDFEGLLQWVNITFPLRLTPEAAGLEGRDVEGNAEFIEDKVKAAYELKSSTEDPEALQGLERYIILNAVDRLWQEHLYGMDSLRDGIGLRSYAQKDPLVEYKTEAYSMFEALMHSIKEETLQNLFRTTTNLKAFEELLQKLPQKLQDHGSGAAPQLPGAAPSQTISGGGGGSALVTDEEDDGPTITIPLRRELPKVGRNDPCPCGSGKKFKQCCGRKA